MREIYILLLLVCTLNNQVVCGQDNTQPVEYIELDSVLINVTLPFRSDTSCLYRTMGKPSLVEIPDYDLICASYFGKDFNYLKYDDCEFEAYKDQTFCLSMDFRNNSRLEFKTGRLVLNGQTTISELRTFFPAAVSSIREFNVAGTGKVFCIELPASKKPTDDHWILFFNLAFIPLISILIIRSFTRSGMHRPRLSKIS